MSQPSLEVSAPSVLTKKSPWNVYTVMLLVAFLALLVATICLYLEVRAYGGFGAVKGPQASVTRPVTNVATQLGVMA